jgi:hypothetical protein
MRAIRQFVLFSRSRLFAVLTANSMDGEASPKGGGNTDRAAIRATGSKST